MIIYCLWFIIKHAFRDEIFIYFIKEDNWIEYVIKINEKLKVEGNELITKINILYDKTKNKMAFKWMVYFYCNKKIFNYNDDEINNNNGIKLIKIIIQIIYLLFIWKNKRKTYSLLLFLLLIYIS